MSILRVRDLGKAYCTYPSEWVRFARWFGLPFKPSEENWVLRHVSFDIQPGEALGIVGQNGAGKSTLLKLITGTLQPSSGGIEINGRISALLELGLGFNEELTGRQNAFHSAGLFGIQINEIKHLMPEIEAFADIGEYFDKPVRTYSSGMQVRVAFAVATAVRPDLLIVDEALSVGDSFFQHKCMQRIRGFCDLGTSLLLVSHSDETIRAICKRAILIESGQMKKIGNVASVLDYYRAKQVLRMNPRSTHDGQSSLAEQVSLVNDRDHKYVIVSKTGGGVTVELTGDENCIMSGQNLAIRVKVNFREEIDDPHIGFGIRTKMGVMIYEANTYTLKYVTHPIRSGETLTVTFKFFCVLAPGTYELTIGVADGGYDTGLFRRALFFDQSFLIFEVVSANYYGWSGLCDLQPEVIVGLSC